MATEQITPEHFDLLYQKWRAQQLSEQEWALFRDAAGNPELQSTFTNTVLNDLQQPEFDQLLTVGERQDAYRLLMEQIAKSEAGKRPLPHRAPFLRSFFFRYAAAFMLLAGIAAYLYLYIGRNEQTVASNDNRQLNIVPGGNKAVLTLADGTKLLLDSAQNGNIAEQGNTQIVNSNGQIVYDVQNHSSSTVLWNTMSTPVGGQYQVSLPDGTRAWLNAASSITFPTVFSGEQRLVKVSGEVYFEVAKNKQKPFVVDIGGKSLVEVLGTSFNINSYQDDEFISTTLLEGSIKVSSGVKGAAQPAGTQSQSVIIKPGQKALIAANSKNVRVNDADLEQTLAWKNGLFNFNGLHVHEVMRQLERWYNIDVKFEGNVSNITFKGKMFRNVNLSDVLEMFQKMEVKFKIEGRTLIITE